MKVQTGRRTWGWPLTPNEQAYQAVGTAVFTP